MKGPIQPQPCKNVVIISNSFAKKLFYLLLIVYSMMSCFCLSKAMEGSMLTISLGIWMELPGVNYRDITPGKRRYAL